MERLKTENLNTAGEYDRIFEERIPDWSDQRRWKELLKYCKPLMQIVDIGCLNSRIKDFAPHAMYLGTDVAKQAIQSRASHNTEPRRCKFIVDDIYKSSIPDGFGDYVILGEVLEHLERPWDAVKEAFRILEPRGVLAISVPLEEAKEPGAVDGDRHLWSFNEQDIRNMVQWYSGEVKTKVLRSQWFPKYRYCWPQLIVWATKK